jgi:hypothetical protein
MQRALESWKRSASTSRGPAIFDDATSAALVRLMTENAKIEVATLEILNEQTVQTEQGEELPSEWAVAALHALSDIGGFRPALPELDLGVLAEDGDDSGNAADEAENAGNRAAVAASRQLRARRAAVREALVELGVISGLSSHAAERRRREEQGGLEGVSDGCVLAPMLKVKEVVRITAKALTFVLLKALVVGSVSTAQVGTLWWVIASGDGAEAQYERAVYMTTGQWGVAFAVICMCVFFQITKSTTAATTLRALSLAVPTMLPLMVWALYFRLGGDAQSVSAYAVAAPMCLAALAAFMLTGLHVGWTIRRMPVNEASRNAVIALHAVVAPDSAGNPTPHVVRSKRRAAIVAAKAALPQLFVVATGSTYVFGIFAAYRAASTTWLKAIIFFLALGAKVSGNKAQLWLMQRMPRMPRAIADESAFFYEYMMTLLCRVLVMSIPDLEMAKLLSVVNTLIEVSARLHFLVRYLVDGVRLVTDEERTAWRERGYWRSLDGNNDNVIEYVTTVVSALTLYLLPQLGTFEFATSEESASDAGRLLTLVAINVLPEVFVDGFCLWTEALAGLGPMHLHYWCSMSPLTVLVKASTCYAVTAFVLGACVSRSEWGESGT